SASGAMPLVQKLTVFRHSVHHFVVLACHLVVQEGHVERQSRTQWLHAARDPRGKPALVLCIQNLQNFGKLEAVRRRDPGVSKEDLQEKTVALVTRFLKARCDVVAVQEVLSNDVLEGNEALAELAKE